MHHYRDSDALEVDIIVQVRDGNGGAFEEAVRARSLVTLQDPGALHDPEAVSATYLIAAAILQL